MKTKQHWYVAHNFFYGWDDAGWLDDDQPLRFNTEDETNEAIAEYLVDQNAAVDAGDMIGKQGISDFRAQKEIT